MTNHLYIDPFSGIAGDMFLGAMVDLGVDLDAVRSALAALPVERPYEITTDRVQRHGIGAVDLKVKLLDEAAPAKHEDTHSQSHHHGHPHHHEHEHNHHHADEHGHSHTYTHDHDHGHHHHHTGYRDIMSMVEQLDTTPRGRSRAAAVVTALAEAESRVHAKPLDEIHFHEVGAVDSIVDMLGSVVALELLEIDKLSCGVLPMSAGFVHCDHGLMPVPAPATAYLLEGLPTLGVDRRGELVTPTGAALVKALCTSFGPPPAMTVRGVGYGAGDRRDPKVPNLLRLFRGEVNTSGSLGPIDTTAVQASPHSLAAAD
ncbi:MAG: LarC family nickel insertion protein [Planctomycetota bacterium]